MKSSFVVQVCKMSVFPVAPGAFDLIIAAAWGEKIRKKYGLRNYDECIHIPKKTSLSIPQHLHKHSKRLAKTAE